VAERTSVREAGRGVPCENLDEANPSPALARLSPPLGHPLPQGERGSARLARRVPSRSESRTAVRLLAARSRPRHAAVPTLPEKRGERSAEKRRALRGPSGSRRSCLSCREARGSPLRSGKRASRRSTCGYLSNPGHAFERRPRRRQPAPGGGAVVRPRWSPGPPVSPADEAEGAGAARAVRCRRPLPDVMACSPATRPARSVLRTSPVDAPQRAR